MFGAVQPNLPDPVEAMKAIMTGSLVIAVLGLLFLVLMFSLWVWALVRAIDDRANPDRMMWIALLVVLGPLAAVIYLMKSKPTSPPPLIAPSPAGNVPKRTTSNSVTFRPPPIPFNTADMHDERKRAEAIRSALARRE